jgi:insulysin
LVESLDELSELASTYFSPILNRGYDPLPNCEEHPFGSQEKGTFVSIQTIMSFYALEFSFPLEWQAPQWQLKAGSFIAHLVGHEGPGSLHSYLKKKGWITELSSGPQILGRGFDMFRVSIYLTNDGWSALPFICVPSACVLTASSENHRSVIMAVMKYFSLLRDSTFESYHQDEIVALDRINFRFKEKGRPDDYTSAIAARMTRPYPPELLISAPSLSWPWKENEDPLAGERKVREYLDGMRINKGRVLIMGKPESFEELAPSKPDDWAQEPWYGTKYRVERVDQAFIDEVSLKGAHASYVPNVFSGQCAQ